MVVSNWADGFEAGNKSAWNGSTLTTAVHGNYRFCGDYGLEAFLLGSGSAYVYHFDVDGVQSGQSSYSRVMFNFPLALPVSGKKVGIFRIRDGSGAMVALVSVTYDGSIYELVLEVEPDGGTYSSGSIALSTATWYCLQVKVYMSNTGHAYVKLDGSTKISVAGIDTRGTFNHNYWDIGAISTDAGARVYFDDFEVDPSSFAGCLSPPPDVPTGVNATDNLTDRVTVTWTKKTGATGYKIYRDNVLIDTVGDVNTYNDFSADAPNVSPGTASATDGTYPDKVRLTLSGEGKTPGDSYTYKVSSLNACGESAKSSGNSGHREAGTITRQWQVDDGGGWDDIPGGTTDTYDYEDAPLPTITAGDAIASDGDEVDHVDVITDGAVSNNGEPYNYRCRVSAAGALTQSSTSNTGYTGADFLSYQWQRSSGDAPSGWSNIIGATTDAYDDFAAPAAVVHAGTATATDGTYEAYVRLVLSGEYVLPTKRYWRCQLTAGAINATTSSNRGYRGYDPITYQWKRSSGTTDNNFSNIIGATTDPYNDVGAPSNGDYRWYYCVVSSGGAGSDNSTHNRGFRGSGIDPPTVTTQSAINIAWDNGTFHATLRGTITDVGGENPDERGFEWGYSTGNYPYEWTQVGSFGIGSFSRTVTSLDEAVVYFRAKARNSGGWAYGSEETFDSPVKGHITEVYYWVDGMGGWEDFTSLPYTPQIDDEIHTYVTWVNDGLAAAVGHVDVRFTAPDLDTFEPVAVANQDQSAGPGSGWSVQFAPVTVDENGTWNYWAQLKLDGVIVDIDTFNFTVGGDITSMIGGPTSWVWGVINPGVSVVRITTDGGLTWSWGLATGNITIPVGDENYWMWSLVSL